MRKFVCISPRSKASFGESVLHHAERRPHDIDIVPAIRAFADPVRPGDAIGVDAPIQESGKGFRFVRRYVQWNGSVTVSHRNPPIVIPHTRPERFSGPARPEPAGANATLNARWHG
jgi:hypothetical protein